MNSYDEQWWMNHFDSKSVESWQGLSFELLCLMHIRQIRKALNIAGVATEVTAWFDPADKEKAQRGSQIDLIIERADRIIHLCEMKFCQGPFRITADYDKKIRDRTELFREKTANKKSLVHTFVTTYGVANGIHSSLVHSEVKLDDLFIPLLDLPEIKALRHQEVSKEELIEMIKEKMSKEELLRMLLNDK